MENKIITSNNSFQRNKSNKRNIKNPNQIENKTYIKNYKLSNTELHPKKSETKFYSKINNQIKKPNRYTKQNSKELKDNKKQKITTTMENKTNKTEIGINNKIENRIKNIKVNKINFEKNDFQNKTNIINNTNPNHQEIIKIYLKKEENKNLYLNDNNYKYNNKTTIVKKKINKDSIKFKDLKTFFAHIEIFLCLYLKKIFKDFLLRLKSYEKYKKTKDGIFNNDTYHQVNNFRPIVNVNNAHCSLYCSINVNQDKLINTLLNSKNFSSFSKNTFTPLNKMKQNKNENDNKLKPNETGIIKRNKNISINPIGFNFNTENFQKEQNKLLSITKHTLTKDNNDYINSENISNTLYNNSNIKISPIKEMNINLGQLNLSRLNYIDKSYSNYTSANKNNINRRINFDNQFNNDLLNKMKNCCTELYNINSEKSKLKKIKSVKNDIYIKPQENIKKQSIKEIKIEKNKLTPKTSYTNINSFSSFCKINNRIQKKNDIRIQTNEQNMIKKIYIKRGNQNNNVFNYSNISHYNSTFINFKADNEKSINDVLLIKEIQTLDNRIFINVKYMPLYNKNHIKINRKKRYIEKNSQIARLYSISIINNKISLNKELYENLKMYNINNYKGMTEYYFFDNDKNKILKNIINLINIIKSIISNKILKILSIKYAKRIALKTLLKKNYKKIINKYFTKFIYNTEIKNNKIIHVIYHKINYNDDFNKNNRFQTPKNENKFKKIVNPRFYNLTHKNSNNQINFRKKIIENQPLKDSFSNVTYKAQKKIFNSTYKIYHNYTRTNINNNINI